MANYSQLAGGSRDFLGAVNAWKPVFYKAAVEGKSSVIAFPDDWSKGFYVECLKSAFAGTAVTVVAYSVVHNRAYFILGSLDQAPVSVLRCLEAANAVYAQYYNENYIKTGLPFKDKIRHKKIKDDAEVFGNIALVHGQPAAAGLCSYYDDYAFSSYQETPGKGLSSIVTLYQRFSAEKIVAEYTAAHNAAPVPVTKDFLPLEKFSSFDNELEKCLIDYRVYQRDNVPVQVMAKIIIDMNDKAGFDFAFITDSLFSRKHEKYKLLVMTVSEMCLRLRMSYDEAMAKLGASSYDDTLIKDIVIYINNELSYSYDYIMGVLGLAYPNLPFYGRLLDYICNLKGISRAEAVRKLGITDEAMIKIGVKI